MLAFGLAVASVVATVVIVLAIHRAALGPAGPLPWPSLVVAGALGSALGPILVGGVPYLWRHRVLVRRGVLAQPWAVLLCLVGTFDFGARGLAFARADSVVAAVAPELWSLAAAVLVATLPFLAVLRPPVRPWPPVALGFALAAGGVIGVVVVRADGVDWAAWLAPSSLAVLVSVPLIIGCVVPGQRRVAESIRSALLAAGAPYRRIAVEAFAIALVYVAVLPLVLGWLALDVGFAWVTWSALGVLAAVAVGQLVASLTLRLSLGLRPGYGALALHTTIPAWVVLALVGMGELAWPPGPGLWLALAALAVGNLLVAVPVRWGVRRSVRVA